MTINVQKGGLVGNICGLYRKLWTGKLTNQRAAHVLCQPYNNNNYYYITAITSFYCFSG